MYQCLDLTLEQKIEFQNKLLKALTEQNKCEHEINIVKGEDTSTTGPTGLYEDCHKCGYHKLVGHVGEKGPVIYAEEEKKRTEILKKEKSFLTDEEIEYLKWR